jgi:DNA modification methylase
VEPEARLTDKWGVSEGDIYEVQSERGAGVHRVMCGDSTSRRDVRQLTDAADLLVTDPPYSSGGFQASGKCGESSKGTKADHNALERDGLSVTGYRELMSQSLAKVKVQRSYIFTDWRMWEHCKAASESAGYPVRQMIIWMKRHAGMGAGWRQQAELVCYGSRAKAETEGSRSNVIEHPRSGNEHHPTEKPIGVIRELVSFRNPSTCYDPFTGSGSTLLACEIEGVQFYGMEVAPKYVASALERCQRFGLSVKEVT